MHVVIDNQIQRVTLPASAKSLVVDGDPQRRLLVIELLGNMGFNTVESGAEIPEVVEKTLSISAQNLFLVLYAEPFSNVILQQLKALQKQRPMPVLLLINDLDKEAMTSVMKVGVTAFVSLGVQSNRIKHAVNAAFANFDVVSDLQQQISVLESRLENRIVTEKAKGLIMKNRGLDEAQAYDYLRKYAMKNGKKLIEVAEMTIATAELLDKEN